MWLLHGQNVAFVFLFISPLDHVREEKVWHAHEFPSLYYKWVLMIIIIIIILKVVSPSHFVSVDGDAEAQKETENIAQHSIKHSDVSMYATYSTAKLHPEN